MRRVSLVPLLFRPALALVLFAWLCRPLPARELAAYRVGDRADADIVTPVALEVVDPDATTAFQLIKSQQFPAIFRSYPGATNAMTQDLLTAFDRARTNFLADLAIEFHSATVNEPTIASADFERLVTVFGVENKSFPAPDELAAEWARGGDGHALREKLLAALNQAENRPVRPDVLPQGMVIGETIRLVPVTDPAERLSFETVQQGALAPAASLTTLAGAQALFRRDFSAGQPVFARALAAFLQPNCFPDAPFTQLTRGAAETKVVVSDHYDAGDVMVHKGDLIDAKIHSALAALGEKMASRPPPPSASAHAPAPPAAAPLIQPQPKPAPPPELAHAATAPDRGAIMALPPEAKSGLRHPGLIITLAAISTVSLLVAWGQFLKERKRAVAPLAVAQAPLLFPEASPTGPALAPQVEQAVREAVQQELAMQRRELLLAQQAATDEIIALVQRLDQLQAPMQERLQTYEAQIQSLERELALRNEENRELLKIKIELISRQLQTERASTGMN